MKNRLSINAARIDDLADLPTLDHRELVEKWQLLYGTNPPVGVKNNFLIHGIAHRIQEKALGGLKPATRHFLEKSAQDNVLQQKILPTISIKPGTRLLREWHGVTYEVIILEKNIMCNDKEYRSLTEVARAITGARWSGPLFFGLKKKDVT